MSVLANSQTKTMPVFANDEGGKMDFGHFKIIQALAEGSGISAYPTAAGALPAAPELVPVTPAVGAVGIIALATWADGAAPFTTPTIGPEFHAPRSLTLHAPTGNAGNIYWAQNDAVRPLGATTAILGPEKVSNPAFTTDMAGWSTSGDFTFASDTPGAYINFSDISDAVGRLTQPIFSLPPGTYAVQAVIATLFATTGSSTCSVQINDVEVMQFTGADDTTVNYKHGGGPMTLKIVLTIADNEGDGATCLITSLSIKRSGTAAANVGTALAAGETIILTARDLDLTRPLYVVPIIANAGEEIVANYLY